MQYRKLGTTDIDVSVICLGTMTWGNQNTQDQGHAQMDYALDQGVNFFDTAELYAVPTAAETQGATERIIGEWFKTRHNRDQVILASKIAGRGIPWIREGGMITPEAIFDAVEGSLKRLQTDYIDLYQLHWSNRPNYHFTGYWTFSTEGITGVDTQKERDDFEAILRALDTCVKQGKIRHVGLSNETAWGTMEYLRIAEQKSLPRMVSIQNEYSLLDRIFEPDLAEIALREKIGLLAWSPLATGMLSGKYLDKIPEGTRWSIQKSWRDTPQSQAATRAYMDLAAQHGLDVCQMALAFVHSRPFVTSTIIGATNMDQLKSNIQSINVSLSPEILIGIDEIYRQYMKPW
jgi:aryl-alcohol dehydrogenase-like predicted oxidoreductase